MKKIINNEIVDLTAEEISQREADIAKAEVEATKEQEAKEAYDTLKASAKAKLIAGEALTEEEANTIVL